MCVRRSPRCAKARSTSSKKRTWIFRSCVEWRIYSITPNTRTDESLQLRARIERQLSLHAFVELASLRRISRRQHDLQHDVLIAWRRARQAATLQAQPLSRFCVRRNAQVDGSGES